MLLFGLAEKPGSTERRGISPPLFIYNVFFTNVDFRKVMPVDYKLFQVADLLCSVELLSLKAEAKTFSKSLKCIFDSIT